MRFVFVTDELPRSGAAGHLVMNHAIIEWLQEAGHQVTILSTRPRLRWPIGRYSVAPVAGPGLGSWHDFVFANGPRGAISILGRRVLSALPSQFAAPARRWARDKTYGAADEVIGAFISPVQSAWCAARIREMSPDAVLVDTIFRAPLLREPGMQTLNSVIIAHDLFHRRHRAISEAGHQVHPPQLSRQMELELLNTAKAIAVIQPEEAAEIGRMCPGKPVCVAAMPAQPCPVPADQKKLKDRLVFVGSATLPNIDGLRWFFADVWPLLLSQRPGVSLDLVGDCGAAIGRLPKNVQRLGRVENLSTILHRSMLAIAPLRLGSGLKIKILDYARHGLITVATPESLRGFAADPEAPFIAAPDAQGFAKAILAKPQTYGTADQQRALKYVSRHYNAGASFSGLGAVLGLPGR